LLGAGRDYFSGPWTFGPRANLQYTRAHADDIVETASDTSANGSGWATKIDSTSQESLVLQIGGKVSYAKSTNWGVIIPYVQVDLLHEFKQDSQLITGSFIQDGTGSKLQIQTDNPDRNYIKINLGSTAQFKQGISGFANYSTILSNSTWDGHTVSVGVRVEF